MTRVRVRTRTAEIAGPRAVKLLDWFEKPGKRTVDCTGDFIDHGPRLSLVGEDLLRLGGSVYCADRVVRRDRTVDRWQREITLELGVSDRDLWETARPSLTEALEFLSGDAWRIVFRRSAGRIPQITKMSLQAELADYEAVCLFSGGLDSLCGAIALLDSGRRVALVAHHENGLASARQRSLAQALAGEYGVDRLRLFQLHLGPSSRASGQRRRLPKGADRDSSFRGRSMLFLSAGLAMADAIGPDVPLHVPENGFIGINVPLRPTRGGSLSTRTTHPWFMDRLRDALRRVGFRNPIENPFRTLTKGELVGQVVNEALIERLVEDSLSCAHPESLYHFGISPQHCGYCFPCMIRQGSLHAAGIDDQTRYAFDVLNDDQFLDSQFGRAADPLAVFASLRRTPGRFDVLRNGPVSSTDVTDFAEVYSRGRAELRGWIAASGSAAVRAKANT